jgi:hypothetical protein
VVVLLWGSRMTDSEEEMCKLLVVLFVVLTAVSAAEACGRWREAEMFSLGDRRICRFIVQ